MSKHQVIYEILRQYGQEEKFERINDVYELNLDYEKQEPTKKETRKINVKNTKDYM